ncbi:MAG: SMC-Scp complex subunit ScpB [Spirochaetales bacterium]|nr:SMC-Scp complex subunit ScpB [Spirochaetales bacterium]
MELTQEAALVEVVLFLESDPLEIREICRITELSKDTVEKALETLREHYLSSAHGLELILLGGGYLLSPKKDSWGVLKDRYGKKNANRLSRAALETLSIIAYSQPITRAEIENIRGVAADGMIKILNERDLIKVVGKKDAPGKPVQYGTTKEFLRLFRLNSIADLPSLSDIDRDRFERDDEA